PMDVMTIEVELALPAPRDEPFVAKMASDVRNHLKNMVGVTCDVVLKAPGEVPRSQGKAVRGKDLRQAAEPWGTRCAGGAGSRARRASPANEEQLILVDERTRATGIAGKTVIHRAGLLHRAFSIFIVDDRGRIVVQQRSPKKYHSGGLWANSCCGHPRPGERTAFAARRRLDHAPAPPTA